MHIRNKYTFAAKIHECVPAVIYDKSYVFFVFINTPEIKFLQFIKFSSTLSHFLHFTRVSVV